VTTGGIAHNVVFQDPRVFEAFQLAKVLEATPGTSASRPRRGD
jgi:hypothetical protein